MTFTRERRGQGMSDFLPFRLLPSGEDMRVYLLTINVDTAHMANMRINKPIR